VCVLGIPRRSAHRQTLKQRFNMIVARCRPSCFLGSRDVLDFFSPSQPFPTRVLAIEDWITLIHRSDNCPEVASHIDPCSLAIIQPTSGTTGTPNLVAVPRQCLEANHAAIRNRMQINADDIFLSWLPLYHDMGLIGMLGITMMTGAHLILADPKLFSRSPAEWMRQCSKNGATITAGPDFAYGIAASLLTPSEQLDLATLRLVLNGSEPVNPESFSRFVEQAGLFGMPAAAAFPVYGLAEATLAVTFPDIGAGLTWDEVDRSSLEKGLAVPCLSGTTSMSRVTSLGTSLDGITIQIVDSEGCELDDREIGEIVVSGDSITPGYFEEEPRDSGSWLYTGDLGYISNHELFVCGRSKDLIIVAGRNVYPYDLEGPVSMIPGIWRGHVAAFGTLRSGTERAVIVAETQVPSPSLLEAVREKAIAWCDVRPLVRLVEPHAIPRTTSGKISRTLCRQLFESGQL